LTPTTPAPADNNQQNPMGNGAFMKWFFPIFSLIICFQYNAGFALYWVASNVIAAVQTFLVNKYLDAKDAKEKNVTVGEGTIK
ncbi:MAG: YidC/Oxa1 family membrane protein insertase, partial [Clostridia bacterium]|nr:YidC/Oxa1 family membrane protein insertase [Clostridia bacterium]